MSPNPSAAFFFDTQTSTIPEVRYCVISDVDELAECFPSCNCRFVQRSKGPFAPSFARFSFLAAMPCGCG